MNCATLFCLTDRRNRRRFSFKVSMDMSLKSLLSPPPFAGAVILLIDCSELIFRSFLHFRNTPASPDSETCRNSARCSGISGDGLPGIPGRNCAMQYVVFVYLCFHLPVIIQHRDMFCQACFLHMRNFVMQWHGYGQFVPSFDAETSA